MGFLKRRADPAGPVDSVQLAIAELRRAGVDPTKPHETRHFMYVPGVKNAHKVARGLQRPDRRLDIETSARKGYWLVAVIQPVVIAPETLAALRDEFVAAVWPYGGEYDYWQIAVEG